MSYWYISFATDEAFLGAAVVEAVSAQHALLEATSRGLNPGGESMIIAVPNYPEAIRKSRSYLNRLVSEEELLGNGAKQYGDLSEDKRQIIDDRTTIIEDHATKVCADCNTTKGD